MKIKFANPTSFDGMHRGCIEWKTVKGGALRCKKYKRGNHRPTCPGKGLKGGGRSQNYIRGKKACGKRRG